MKEPDFLADFLGSLTAALRDPVMPSRCVQALNRCMLNKTPSIVEINGKPYAVFKGLPQEDKQESLT